MNIHPIITPASPSLASPIFDASFDSIESLTTTFTASVLPTIETTTVTEVALGYHRNQQYSITAMTTSTGAVAERYAYTAYGQPTILDASGSAIGNQQSPIANRFTYTGREWDETLGLHHFRARWMSPLAGRFLGRDPIGYEDSINLHEFGLLLSFLDPTGQWVIPGDRSGPEWHHDYPWNVNGLKDLWPTLGINPDAEECGCMLMGPDHANLHPAYQKRLKQEIEKFIMGPPQREITKQDVERIVSDLKNSPEFKHIFDKSRKACCTYKEWRDLGPEGRRQVWDLGEASDALEKLRERLRSRGTSKATRALKNLGGGLALLAGVGGFFSCLGGGCDAEIQDLVSESRKLVQHGALTPSGLLACVGYFNAFNKLGTCAGLDQDMFPGSLVGAVCAEVYAGQ